MGELRVAGVSLGDRAKVRLLLVEDDGNHLLHTSSETISGSEELPSRIGGRCKTGPSLQGAACLQIL